MTNISGFEKHNIQHLSASSINMFAECAGAWAARYIFCKKFHFGVAPQIGILTEKVVQDVLLGDTLDNAVKKAEDKFIKDNKLNTSEKDLSRVHDIRAMSEHALFALKEYGDPEFIYNTTEPEQQRIELLCNGGDWKIPVIGFVDFVFPQSGTIIDLKTTLRMPSTMSDSHARQSAIYRAANGNAAVKFLYVTPKKYSFLEVEDQESALASVKAIATRMEAFLRYNDKESIRQSVPVNLGSYYWNNSESIAKELYGV